MNEPAAPLSRRELLRRIGRTAGAAVMYQSMTALGFAAESPYRGALDLGAAPRGRGVLVLGAGLAGLVAALDGDGDRSASGDGLKAALALAARVAAANALQPGAAVFDPALAAGR